MYYSPNNGYMINNELYIKSRFINTYTLNIFSDGSYTKSKKLTFGGFASIAIVEHDIIDSFYRGWNSPDNSISVNIMELIALRNAISMAFLYKNYYSNINIFTDSSYALNSIKSYIYKWTFNPNNKTYKTSCSYASNIELIYEISMNLINLMTMVPNLNLYFIKAHINPEADNDIIEEARQKFIKINEIQYNVEPVLIRYLSRYNNIADKCAKKGSSNTDFNSTIEIPIQFEVQDINKYANTKLLYNPDFDSKKDK